MEKKKKTKRVGSTHISVILDRSGSMESIRDDTIGGFNAFLGDQKKLKGEATLTLVQFDSEAPYEAIHRFRPVREVPELTRGSYVPRAETPLLDALGRGINDLENSLGKLTRRERPAKVIFAVVTDGQENASREFKKKQIMKMIKEKKKKDGWQFVFLSADLDAIEEARGLGVQASCSMAFEKNADGTRQAWEALAKNAADFRGGLKEDMSFEPGDGKHTQDPNRKKKK